MTQRRFHVVFNPRSGTAQALGLTTEDLVSRFNENGIDATIDADDDAPLTERVARAVASDADVIVAAGGDGTAAAVARGVIDTDKTLAVLPLGTMNVLARDLNVPLDLDEAIAVLGAGELRRIDVGELNGSIFLESVAIGVVTPLAAMREAVRGKGFGATLSFIGHCIGRLSQRRRYAVELEDADGGGTRIERVRAIVIANGPYDEEFGHFLSRRSIDSGALSVYVVRRLSFLDAVRLGIEMLAGRWKDDDALDIQTARSVEIRIKPRRMRVVLDGEVEMIETPLRFRIRPLALPVIAPATEAASVGEEAVPAVADA